MPTDMKRAIAEAMQTLLIERHVKKLTVKDIVEQCHITRQAFYYHFEGIREHGFVHYFGHFMGPVKWLAPLMFPVEIISHLSRIISLSFRLFGNVKGDDIFLLVMLMLAPWVAPLPAFAILTFMAFLQAFIFMILTYVYLAGALLIDEEQH